MSGTKKLGNGLANGIILQSLLGKVERKTHNANFLKQSWGRTKAPLVWSYGTMGPQEVGGIWDQREKEIAPWGSKKHIGGPYAMRGGLPMYSIFGNGLYLQRELVGGLIK